MNRRLKSFTIFFVSSTFFLGSVGKTIAVSNTFPVLYEMYYQFEEAVSKIAGHRILAINRGEKEKILTVKQ